MKANLKFRDYIVNSIEFKNNFSFVDSPVEIDFDINSEVNFISENEFFLGLEVELFREAEKNNYPFNFKVEMIGSFEIECDDTDQKKILSEQNSVAILFPYVRALVSTYTSVSNVSPVILPPINVIKYLQNKKLKEV